MPDIQELFKELDIEPRNLSLYQLALTHSSYNGDVNTKHHDYERLEFMGDAVISFVTADMIYHTHPSADEGTMSKLRSYVVKSRSLATFARSIKLYDYITAGHSLNHAQISQSDALLEDVFEALTGAIYLDLGLQKAYQHIKRFLYNTIEELPEELITDYKSKLQESMQAIYKTSVNYVVSKMEGPAHDRTFYVDVLFNGLVLGHGVGKSKKAAEELAAKDALEKRV